MKIRKTITIAALVGGMVMFTACGTSKKAASAGKWESFKIKDIFFDDQAPDSKGSKIYHAIIPDPEAYINKVSREVLNTL